MKTIIHALFHSFGVVTSTAAALLMAMSAHAQTLYESDLYSGAINEFNSAGTATNFVSSTESLGAQIAFNSSGDLFVGNNNGPSITEITPNGTVSSFGSGFNAPTGVAVNSAGDVFVSNYGNGEIIEVAPDGSESVFASGLNNPNFMTFNNAGDLFESDWGSGNIYEFTPDGTKSLYASGFQKPTGLAFNNAGNLYVANNLNGGTVSEITSTGTTNIITGLDNVQGLAFNNAGDLFIAVAGGSIEEITPTGATVFSTQVHTPEGLAFRPVPPPGPGITQDLTNSYALGGQNISFSLSVTDAVPFSYQWYFNPSNNSGQAGAYAETISGFVYGAVVTNGGFGYGNVPNVSFFGGNASIDAEGYATVSNGVVTGITVTNAGYGYTSLPAVAIDPPNGFIYGQTNSTLVISNASINNLGNYFVVVSDANGDSVTSSIASFTLVYTPTITNNPVGFSGSLGGSGSLSVSAAGTPPFSYQWMLNDTNVFDATNSTYEIPSLTLTNVGSYTVEVSNPYGSADSSPVNVFMLPSLNAPFTGAIGIWGQDVDLDVGAVGSGMLNYQWYYNGQPISGANNSSYDLNSIQFTNAGFYSVVVSSAYGSVTNATYQVVVNPSNATLALRPDVIIQGIVGYSYTIESNTNLSNANSWTVETNITLTSPTFEWIDYNADTSKPTNPQKFYQVLPGQ